MRLRCVGLVLLWALLMALASAAEMTVAISVDELDQPKCQAFVNGKPVSTADAEKLAFLLGLAENNTKPREWSTAGGVGRDRAFRIAFATPIALGTIFTSYSGGTAAPNDPPPAVGTCVSFLKPDAAYPGDVAKDEQWVTLPAGQLKTLPLGVKTRALRFTERNRGEEHVPSLMGTALLFRERYYSALNLGGVKQSQLPKKPETWMGSWREAQTVVGLLVSGMNSDLKVEALKPDTEEHPLIAPGARWLAMRDIRRASTDPVVYRFDRPLTTMAVRITAAPMEWRSNVGTVLPLVNLGEKPDVPSLVVPAPPYIIPYAMPLDGFLAMDIVEKATGKLVRRLNAEVERGKGPRMEAWDLKDEAGAQVPPGEYAWKAVARPPFKLTYEMTVNNAGQPAWWAPAPGKGGGGWMADHTPPYCVAAQGERMWLGSQVAESGHALIATDLDGNKQWGEGSVSWGFSGPERIAVDARYAYLVNDAIIQRVDPQDGFKTKTVWDFKHTYELPGNGLHWDAGQGGAAINGDKLYVAYSAPPENWLRSSFPAEVIDPMRCMPSVRLAKGNGKRTRHADPVYGEAEYDELMRLYAAFLTGSTPDATRTLPATELPSSTQAYFGDAAEVGPLVGTLTVVLSKPVALGSVVLPDAGIKVYALKPGAKLPDAEPDVDDIDQDLLGGGGNLDIDQGNPFSEDFWVPLTSTGRAGHPGLALAPEGGLYTTALRFKAKRISFAQVITRRLEDVAPQATRVFGEGAATLNGGWSVTRDGKTNPITPLNPARMALVWQEPQSLRGISLVNPSLASMAVDYWVGPANADPQAALDDDSQWHQGGIIDGEIFLGYFVQKATLRSVDFGALVTTRAVRVRALMPEGSKAVAGTSPVYGQHRAGFDAIIAYRHLGDDPPNLPVVLNERLTEFQLPGEDGTGMKILRQLPLAKAGNLAFAADGTLYAFSAGNLVTVPLDGGQPQVVVPAKEFAQPYGLALDADGLIYVSDGGPRTIKVFDKTGKLLRTLLKPGGQQLGAWDPERVDRPTGIAIDVAGKLWVMDQSYQPKRVMRLSRDGKVEKIFLGPTAYGGGGWLDEGDKSVLNYNGMKFVIDWQTRAWKLDSIMFRPGETRSTHGAMPDRAIYLKGKRYLAGDAGGGWSHNVATICREENGIAIPVAAAGPFVYWHDVEERPELMQAFGNLQRDVMSFVWSDRNGDGTPQPDEVQVTDKVLFQNFGFPAKVGEDLSFNFQGMRFSPTEVLPNGVPIYDLAKVHKLPGLENASWTTADGRLFVVWNRLLAPDGTTKLWEYRDEFAIHDGFYRSGWGYNRPPGKLNAEQTVGGHFTLKNAQGKDEEYFVTSSDQGDWFVFTGDGMLVGCIFGGPAGYGKRHWTMPEWEDGKVDLTDLRLGQEHYHACVVRANDGNIYAVAGHNHNSIVRVDGLAQLHRLGGAITITPEQIKQAQAWDVQRAAIQRLGQEPKIAKAVYTDGVEVNGSLDDWPEDLFVSIHEYWEQSLYERKFIIHSQAAFAYDETNLYIAGRVKDTSPAKNTADDLKLLFKGGDALDISLGLDAKADPARKTASLGDIRLLISRVKGKPVIMAYRYIMPAKAGAAVKFKSPVSEESVDVVEELQDMQVEFQQDKDGWIVEAAIPWKTLGAPMPAIGTKIRADAGVLESDEHGMRTVARYYWAGKSQTVVCDVPSEVRIAPILWGDLIFMEADKTMKFGPDDGGLMP